MAWFKGKKKPASIGPSGAAPDQLEDDMPVFEEEPETLAQAVRQAGAPARVQRFDEDDAEEAEGLPSVNRKKRSNKAVTYLGFAFIGLLCIALLFAVNRPKTVKTRKVEGKDQIANTMPKLDMPKPAYPALAKPPAPTAAVPPTPTAAPIPVTGKGSGQSGAAKPERTWYDRKMGGTLMVSAQAAGSTPSNNPARVTASDPVSSSGATNDLAVRLEPTVTKAVSASMLPDRNFLLTKGTALDCALETAIDSTLPGMTTCRLTRDIYSDNGQVLLLDRGSQLVGEYTGGMKNGQARLFVLWSRAKTPNGVVVSLNSPGTDALGRSGHEGWVDNHWVERFGAAILMSVVKDTMAAVIARQSQQRSVQQNDGGTVVYGGGGTTSNPYANTMTGGEQIIGKILDSTANIPPTLLKNQGEHIQVMVARDLDFSGVYGLQAVQ